MLGITLFEVMFSDGVANVWNAVCKVRCSGYEFWTDVCENVTTIAYWNQSFVANISVTEVANITIIIDIEKCNTFQRNTPVGICAIDVTRGTNSEIQKLPVFSAAGGKIIGYFSLKICVKPESNISHLIDSGNPYITTYGKNTDDYTTSQIYHLRIDILRLEGLPVQLINPYVTCEFRSIRLRTNLIQAENENGISDKDTIRSYIFNQTFSFYTLNHSSASDSVTLKLFASENSLLSLSKEIAMGILSYNLLKVQPIAPFWFNLYTQVDGEKFFNGRLLVSGKCVRVTQFGEAKIVAAPFYNLPSATQFNIFVDLYRIITSISSNDLVCEVKCGSSLRKVSINAGKSYLNERVILPISLPEDSNDLNNFKSDYYLEFRLFSNKQLMAHKFTKLKKLFNWQSFSIKSQNNGNFDYLSILMGVEISLTGSSPPMRMRLVKRPFTYRLQIVAAKVNPPTYLNALYFNLAIAGMVKTTSQVTTTTSRPLILQATTVNAEVDVRELGSGNPRLYLCPINIQLVKYIGSTKTQYYGTLELAGDKFSGRVALSGGWDILVNFDLIPSGIVLPLWQPVFKQLSFIISVHRIIIYSSNKYDIGGGDYVFQIYGQKFEFKTPSSKIFRFRCNYPINAHGHSTSTNTNVCIGEKIHVTINNVSNIFGEDQKRNLTFIIAPNGIEKVCPLNAEKDAVNNDKNYDINKNNLPTSIAQGFEDLPIGSDAILHKLRGVHVKQSDSNVIIPKSFLLIAGINGDEIEIAKSPIKVETITPLPYDTASLFECSGGSASVKVGKVKFFTTILHKGSVVSGGKVISDNNLDDFIASSRKLSILSLILNRALCIPFTMVDVAIEFSLGDLKEVVKVGGNIDCGMNLQLDLFWQQQLVVDNTPYLTISVLCGKERVSGIVDLEDLWYLPINIKSETIKMDKGGYLDVEYELVPKETGPTLTPPISMKSKYELRLVVWSVTNVPAGAIDGFVCVKLYTPEYEGKFSTSQFTDLHYNCGGDIAIFNWRFVYPCISYPVPSCILQISFFDYKKLGGHLLLGEYNWDLETIFNKVAASGHGIQEDSTVSLGKCKVQLSMYLLNQAEANAKPVGLGRDEPNLNPKLLTPSHGRAWKDVILSAESSLGISLGLDMSIFYLFIRIGSVAITFIALIIIALVYPAIFA